MNNYERIQVSETFGDCTANYEIVFNRKMQLKEFIDSILVKKEWGFIRVKDYSITYNGDEISQNTIPQDFYSKTIKQCTSSGGWSRMDYEIELDDVGEYDLMLVDRIAKIKAIDEQYNLRDNAYIAYSGGKDSVALSNLIDIALPNNEIPRVFINTGIEFIDIVKFVKKQSLVDKRIIILNNRLNIKKTLNEVGYPFKSKPHSKMVGIYQRNGLTEYIKDYIDKNKTTKFKCMPKLRYQFSDSFKIKIDYKCCIKFKEEPSIKWAKENKKRINLTGLRAEEGSTRANINCVIFDDNKNLTKFHPLLVVSDEWEEEFIKRNKIELCRLYEEPFNFSRTGCKGCPFTRDLQKQLNKLYKELPNEYYQCLHLWKNIYDEYIRIGYRLKYYPHEHGRQMTIDDYMEEK